jgi:hypothetical protein
MDWSVSARQAGRGSFDQRSDLIRRRHKPGYTGPVTGRERGGRYRRGEVILRDHSGQKDQVLIRTRLMGMHYTIVLMRRVGDGPACVLLMPLMLVLL